MSDDRARVLAALGADGVAGFEDFGHFVNDTRYFPPSKFDARAAFPTLLALLSSLSDPSVVGATARYLARPGTGFAVFDALLAAFKRWAIIDTTSTGWTIGESLAKTATVDDLDTIFELVENSTYGRSRQMIVLSLWRYRKDARTTAVLARLIFDPEVSLHAMSALRRAIGNPDSIPFLEQVRDAPTLSDLHRGNAAKAIRAAQRSIERAKLRQP
jgi:hypothetical protein